MKNRTTTFITNAAFSVVQQLAVFLSGLVVPNIMLRIYGSEVNGLVSSVTQLVSYVALIEAGMSGSIVFFLYKPLADKNRDKINSIISAARISYNKLGWLFATLSIIVALVYAFFIGVEGLSRVDIFLLAFFIGLSGALEYFTLSKYRVLFTADQKNYILSLATTASTIVHVLVVILCACLGFSVVALKAISILTVFARSMILRIYLRKHYEWANYNQEPDYSALSKRWDAFYMQVLWSLQSGAPIMIATVFTDMISVSIYSIYNLIITGITNITAIFMSGLQAAFGEILVGNDEEKLNNVYNQFCFAFYGVLSVIFSIAAVMIMPFIRVYVAGLEDGGQYYDVLLGMLFIINGLLFSLKTPQGMMVIAAGHYKETRVQTTIQSALLLVLGVTFSGVFNFGLKGIVFAAIISNGYRLIDLVIYVGKNIAHNSIFCTSKNMVFVILHIVLVFLLCAFWSIPLGGYIGWLIKAVCVGIVSCILLIVRGYLFDKTALLALLSRIKVVFVRKG